jgi:hypothetical protein
MGTGTGESWGWNNDSSAAKISVPVPCDSHPAQPETSPVIRIRHSRKHKNPLHIFSPLFSYSLLNHEPLTLHHKSSSFARGAYYY